MNSYTLRVISRPFRVLSLPTINYESRALHVLPLGHQEEQSYAVLSSDVSHSMSCGPFFSSNL